MRVAWSLLWVLLVSQAAPAFYEWQGDESYGEIRGLLQLSGTLVDNPALPLFYDEEQSRYPAAVARLIVNGGVSAKLDYELQLYRIHVPISPGFGEALRDVERSAHLEWRYGTGIYSRLALDRANVRFSRGRLDLILGRQAVNLADTFYFTPNDFFAPFAAQTFFRLYKPGVDALRAEVRLGALSQFSLINVLGYRPDAESDNGWSRTPLGNRNSLLGRFTTASGNGQWTILGGRVRRENLIGGSYQGELFEWLGVRAEGHVAAPLDEGDRHAEVSIGLEHRWPSTFELRMEYFFHGAGSEKSGDYIAPTGSQTYSARRYLALGAGYEVTPLLASQVVIVGNLVDYSRMVSANLVYSLGDETEVSLSITLPGGETTRGVNVGSEFGSYPKSVTVELRSHF